MPHDVNGTLDVNAIPQHQIVTVRDSTIALDQGQSYVTISHWYNTVNLFEHPPAITDVQQYGVGDCFLLAALHCIIYLDPDLILGMMKDLRGGWVVVRLYDAHGQPLYYKIEKSCVAFKTGTFSKTPTQRHKAHWVYMVEKAYAYYRLNVLQHEITPETWVDDPQTGGRKLQKGAKRRALTYLEALKGGFSEDAIQTLVGGQNKLRVALDRADMNSAACATLTEIISVRPGNALGQLATAALQRVFFSETGPQAQDLVAQFGVPKIVAFMAMQGAGEVLRREKLAAFFDTHYGMLRRSTRFCLDSYIAAQFPGKRGTGLYTPYQVELWKSVRRALQAGNYVAISTDSYLGKVRGQIARTREHKVKGLAGPHAYQVVQVAQSKQPNLYFLVLRNPWLEYVRDYAWKDKTVNGAQVRVLSANEVAGSLDGRSGALGAVTDYGPGTFLLELSDATKRCKSISFASGPNAPLVNVQTIQQMAPQ
jgi:hypothetical protein